MSSNPNNMGQPIPRSVAFHRRNRTTHSWSDSLMSQSLPNTSFMHKQYTSPIPVLNRRAGAGKPSSPLPISGRPSSSYSYDGGFFLGAHAGQADYFVIHPDWVSESLTIRKLGTPTGAQPEEEASSSGKGKNLRAKITVPYRNWSGRRCMSAPPSKFRNPIAWEDPSDPIPIPRKSKKS